MSEEVTTLLGFMVSLKSPISGEVLAKYVEEVLRKNLVVSEVDVDFLGIIDDFADNDGDE